MHNLEAPASPKSRVLALLNDYRVAPPDADVEVHIGTTEEGAAALVIEFCKKSHALLASEAQKLADIVEQTMREFPHDDPEVLGLPNLILALRAGADKSISALSSSERQPSEDEHGDR
jgi:beta-phosphoglucomutase-like phosphatase (HAD superfamily)